MKSLSTEQWARLGLLVFGLVGASGCSPKIGDKCSISTDCSQVGDRLCDPTQPGGYCTVFNCEPNRCPDEAACVAFNEVSCSSPVLSRRFQRTFCMLVCESDDDCRGPDYVCLDTTNDPVRQVVDINPSSRKICAVPPSRSASPPPVDPPICFPPDASPPRGDAAPDATSMPDAAVDQPASPDAAATEDASDAAE